ncbi:MAG: GDP-mannose 4,6-dehydratase [Candidatus Omnitrophota bacterium]
MKKNKIAFITGITGQDGAYLSRILLEKGYKVYGVVRSLSPEKIKNLKYLDVARDIDFVKVDLLSLSKVKRTIDQIRPDEIYNLAAQSSVGLSFKEPMSTLDINIQSALNILETIRTISPRTKFYQASSSEMFGTVKSLPATEETVLHPVSPYAISKATGHWLAVNYREAYKLFCCCGILFNHESVLRPSNFVTKKILSAVVRIALGSKEKLRLGNIDIARDWGYAPEYVQAMWLMLQQEKPDDYIVATGVSHSLREFVQSAFSCLGLDWKRYVVIDKKLFRPADIKVIYGNPKKAKAKLGWQPKIDFAQLIRLLIDEELKLQKSLTLRLKLENG